MAFSDSSITEKDSAAVDRKIKTRFDGVDIHAPYTALLVNDVPVTTAAPMPVGGTLLTALLAALITSGATSQAKKIDDPAGTTDIIVPGGMVRKDTLAAIAPVVGDWNPLLGGPYGDLWVSLATSIAASVDSVQTMPMPDVAAFVNKNADYTTAQTGTALWTPAAGKVFVATSIHVDWSASTDGIIYLWSSTSGAADTSYTAGTDRLIWKFSAQPATKGNGGFSRAGYWVGGGIIYPLRVTTSAGITCTVSADGYEKTP